MSETETPPSGTAEDPARRYRELRSHNIQVADRRTAHRPHRAETLGIVLVVSILSQALGNWLVTDAHVVGHDGLDELARALMVWHNESPQPAAIGWSSPLIPSLFVLPFAVFPSLVSSVAALPLVSGVAAGCLGVALNRVLHRLGVRLISRLMILVALAIQPIVLLHGTVGGSRLLGIALLLAAVGSVIGWYLRADIRLLLLSGLLFAVSLLADFSTLVWFGASALFLLGVLATARARDAELSGSLIGFATPVTYTVAIMGLLTTVMVGPPWELIARSAPAITGSELADAALGFVAATSPATFVIVPLLVILGVRRRDPMAIYLLVVILLAVAVPLGEAALGLTSTPLSTDHGVLLIALTVIGGIWCVRVPGGGSAPVGAAGPAMLALVLLAQAPWVFLQLADYRFQGLEGAFVAAVRTGESQEGAAVPGGGRVGITEERAMAEWIIENVDEPRSILTDNARTFGVIALTGRPTLFYDRVDRGDAVWSKARLRPPGYVDYLLVSHHEDDLVAEVHDYFGDGADAVLEVALRNDRYVLLEVPTGYEVVPGTPEEP